MTKCQIFLLQEHTYLPNGMRSVLCLPTCALSLESRGSLLCKLVNLRKSARRFLLWQALKLFADWLVPAARLMIPFYM